jgi:hypothetical protein
MLQYVKELGYESMDWIQLVRVWWWTLVNTTVNKPLKFHKRLGIS